MKGRTPVTRLGKARTFTMLAALAMGGGCGEGDMTPAPPSDLRVTEVGGGAHLVWKDNSDNEASFMVERKVGDGAFQALATVPFDTTQHHDGPLMRGVTYTYRVMAMPKQGGHSAETKYSNEATFKLAAGP
jgi:hypothetical protein